jgi:carbon-monoxide dehydrogenase medium subunit
MGTIGAAVSINLKSGNGACENIRIVLGSAASVPMRSRKAEGHLTGKVINDALLAEAGELAAAEANPPSDVHGSAEYRREMVKVFVKRVGQLALERAKAA